MARLPKPGEDQGTWGDILNEYLSTALDSDGTLKNSSVTAPKLAPGAVQAGAIANGTVTGVKLADGTVTEAKLHTDVQDKLNATASGGATNLSTSTSATTVTVASDTGTDATIPAATTVAAGVLSAADKTTIDNLANVATTGSYTDLSNTPAIPAQFSPIAGTNVTLSGTYPNVTISATPGAGVTDLSTSTTASSVTIASSTGVDATVAAATVSAAGVLTAADKTKLDGIATGATANSSNATLLSRANHTGTQDISTVTGLQTELDGKTDTETTNDLANRVTDVENEKMSINYRYWNGSGGVGSWGARPSVPAGRHVDAYSTQDVLAPAPPDAVAGDMWFRHPEAV